jgi:hypothetical protein
MNNLPFLSEGKVFNGCETWLLRSTVLENREQGRIHGSMRGQIIGRLIKLHTEELHNV